MQVYAMYVHSSRRTPYATDIASNRKPIETRTQDTLAPLIGGRSLIIDSGRRRSAVIGSVAVTGSAWKTAAELDGMRHLTRIPAGDQFDCKGTGKFCYDCSDGVLFSEAVPLDSLHVLKRTRSYALIDMDPAVLLALDPDHIDKF